MQTNNRLSPLLEKLDRPAAAQIDFLPHRSRKQPKCSRYKNATPRPRRGGGMQKSHFPPAESRSRSKPTCPHESCPAGRSGQWLDLIYRWRDSSPPRGEGSVQVVLPSTAHSYPKRSPNGLSRKLPPVASTRAPQPAASLLQEPVYRSRFQTVARPAAQTFRRQSPPVFLFDEPSVAMVCLRGCRPDRRPGVR